MCIRDRSLRVGGGGVSVTYDLSHEEYEDEEDDENTSSEDDELIEEDGMNRFGKRAPGGR